MHGLENLKKMLIDALEDYSKRDTLTQNSLQMIDTLAHACKNVCKIMESGDNNEYSFRRSYDRGYSGDGYYYDDGMSHRRGRDRMGRFTSRDGSEMAHKLREMMEDAPDEATRSEIQRLVEKMERM